MLKVIDHNPQACKYDFSSLITKQDDLAACEITQILSGIWYLHIPDDVKDRDYCGTEMAPNGVDGDDRYFVRPTDGNWLIYPGNMWHRPGIVQSLQYRFVLAADIQID